MKARPIPLAVRRAVWARSGGICELDYCLQSAVHLHHRRLRSQGGQHTLDNLLAVCLEHHLFIHHNPALSYRRGWLVRSGFEPADVPVLPGGVA